MTRMTAKDFDQGLLDLYDFYAHGKITKREFLDRAGRYAVGGATALTLLVLPTFAAKAVKHRKAEGMDD